MQQPLPVTLLCGFLGAGKTSLLGHLLKSDRDQRLAIMANAMTPLNLETGPADAPGSESRRLIPLSSGCVCCVLKEDFCAQVERLAREGFSDHLIVEVPGVCEPMPVAEAFTLPDSTGRPLLESAHLDTLVTMIDARQFLDDYASADTLQRRGIALGAEDRRGVAEVLVDQAEFANVLVLNKVDLVSPAELCFLEEFLSHLNPDARIVRGRFGRVDPREILGTGRFRVEEAARMPGWLRSLQGLVSPETASCHIGTFVYRAGRPFHPERLWNFLGDRPLKQILRSRGFAWLATRPEAAGLWSQAGRLFSLDPAGLWWAAANEPRPASPDGEPQPADDRRQEIAFIGQDLDRTRLTSCLNECLLRGDELAAGEAGWKSLSDPFPAWDMEASLAHEWPRQPALT